MFLVRVCIYNLRSSSGSDEKRSSSCILSGSASNKSINTHSLPTSKLFRVQERIHVNSECFQLNVFIQQIISRSRLLCFCIHQCLQSQNNWKGYLCKLAPQTSLALFSSSSFLVVVVVAFEFFHSRTFSVILSLMFHHFPLPFTIYDDDDVIIIIFTVMSSPRSTSNSFAFVGAEQPEKFLRPFRSY